MLREKLEFFYLFSDEIVSTLWIFGSFAATIGSAERIRPQTVSTFGEAKVTKIFNSQSFFLNAEYYVFFMENGSDRNEFLCVLRFVSKRGTFCMETECVLYQNGRRFDTKRKGKAIQGYD